MRFSPFDENEAPYRTLYLGVGGLTSPTPDQGSFDDRTNLWPIGVLYRSFQGRAFLSDGPERILWWRSLRVSLWWLVALPACFNLVTLIRLFRGRRNAAGATA
ncbi:MAG: hypothetical protein AAF907_02240 [Planctomycetota bacterium]